MDSAILRRLIQSVLKMLRPLLRMAQAVIRNAHPRPRLKQPFLTSRNQTESAKEIVEYNYTCSE